MTHAPLVEFPLAPLTPIMVSFMVCKESRRFVGSYEARPEKGDVVAFIPYLDLPHYALDEERAIAFIDSNGFRGWIAKDDVSANFDIMNPSHISCGIFFKLFERQGWEATPILWSAIDWKKHFMLRTDDETFDITPTYFFADYDLTTDCNWCGHPRMNNGRGKPKEEKCEACEWSKKDEEIDKKLRTNHLKGEAIIEFDDNSTGFKLTENWE